MDQYDVNTILGEIKKLREDLLNALHDMDRKIDNIARDVSQVRGPK